MVEEDWKRGVVMSLKYALGSCRQPEGCAIRKSSDTGEYVYFFPSVKNREEIDLNNLHTSIPIYTQEPTEFAHYIVL